MENKQTITVRTEDANILCHIINKSLIDEFENFNSSLYQILKSKNYADKIHRITRYSKGESTTISREIKKIYKENKHIIDIINQYSDILMFIHYNYSYGPNNCPVGMAERCKLIYQYILKNIDKLDKIMANLEKIKELGFEKFEFNTNLDFTGDTYFASKDIPKNYGSFVYLDNLEVIPNYDHDIKYKSNGSNYLIHLSLPSNYRVILNQIFLNSLTFDVDRLPKTLTLKETFNRICLLPNAKQQEYNIVRNSVDMSIGIDDLYQVYSEISSEFSKLEGVESKPELLAELTKIKEAIDTIKSLSEQYNQQMIANNEGITQKLLDEEKEEHTRRKELSKNHVHN